MIRLVFHGRPLSKDNEKVFNRAGRPFLSRKFRDYENYIKGQAKSQLAAICGPNLPISGDVHIRLTFYFKNNVRPDLTNLPKSVCDALNGVLWKDDRQITKCTLMVLQDKDERVIVEVI